MSCAFDYQSCLFYPYFHNLFLFWDDIIFNSLTGTLCLNYALYNINSCLKILNKEDPRGLHEFQDGW